MQLAYVDGATGDTAAAIAHYREALRSLEQVGAAPEIAKVRQSLRALGAEG